VQKTKPAISQLFDAYYIFSIMSCRKFQR